MFRYARPIILGYLACLFHVVMAPYLFRHYKIRHGNSQSGSSSIGTLKMAIEQFFFDSLVQYEAYSIPTTRNTLNNNNNNHKNFKLPNRTKTPVTTKKLVHPKTFDIKNVGHGPIHQSTMNDKNLLKYIYTFFTNPFNIFGCAMSRSTTEAKARAVGNPSPAYPPILAPVLTNKKNRMVSNSTAIALRILEYTL